MLGQTAEYWRLRSSHFSEAGLCVWLDSVNRTFRLAHTTVDALVGMNDQHVLALVETVHRTYLDAVRVFAANAALVDDVSHLSLLPEGWPSTSD